VSLVKWISLPKQPHLVTA